MKLSNFHSILIAIFLVAFAYGYHVFKRQRQQAAIDFEIETTKGPFSTKNFRGKKIFFYFGFSRCPNVCPLTFSNLVGMVKQMSEAERKQVVVLFISVDNKRDTLEYLKEHYINAPENFFIGTANDSKLREIMSPFDAAFGTKFEKNGDVVINHTSHIFVLNSNGQWVHSLNFDTQPAELIDAFKSADYLDPAFRNFRQKGEYEVVAENKDCDLAQQPCEISKDQIMLKAELNPKPIETEKSLVLTVKTNSENQIPIAVDITGASLNMGYMRPSFKKISKAIFEVEFRLPVCDLEKMKWKAQVILNTPEQKKTAVNFYFFTTTPVATN